MTALTINPKKAKLLSGYCVTSDTCSRLSATNKDLSFSMCLGYKQTSKKDLFFTNATSFFIHFCVLKYVPNFPA